MRNLLRTISLLAYFGLAPVYSLAEIVRDGSLGPDSNVQASGPDFVIDESMGETAGSNLFHSFSKFDLNSSESATFTATSPVNNVISRITGSTPSMLDGNLRSNIAGANLFFINPNGIVFGENAAINVDGNFHVSTANYLKFDDDSQFSVSLNDTPGILSTASPTAFGFLGNSTPTTITINESKLNFKEQSQVSIIGGDISINSSDTAAFTVAGGQLKIVSVASAGEVPLSMTAPLDSNHSLGNITLQGQDGLVVEVDDDAIDDAPEPMIDLNGDIGGSIVVRGENVEINNFSIATHTLGNSNGNPTGIDFDIGDELKMTGNSQISSTSEAAGKAGMVSIKVNKLTMIQDAEILSDTFSSAPGSEVRIEADTIVLLGDAEVGSDVEGSGDGGEVNVITKNLTIGGEAEISTDTSGTGNGGNVTINASESVLLDFQGGVFADAQSGARAGNINITTPKLVVRGFEEDDDDDGDDEVEDEGEVDDDPFEAAGIYTISTSTGDAGNITVTADTIEVRDEAAIAASAEGGDGGNITINSSEKLIVRGSGILANVNEGVGGNINLKSDFVLVHDSEVVAKAGAGQGGEIVIDGKEFFSSEAIISASAGPAGISGTVTTPTAIDLTSSLAPLETEFQDVSNLFHTECKVRGNIKKQGSFIVLPQQINPTTREGLLVPSILKPETADIPSMPEVIDSDKIADILTSKTIDSALRLSLLARKETSKLSENLAHAEEIIRNQPSSSSKIYGLLHLAVSYSLQENKPEDHLLKAYQLMIEAEKIATSLGDLRARSFVLGNLAFLYLKEHRLDEALQLTRQALQLAGSKPGADGLYRWHRLEGKLLWLKGEAGFAIEAYKRAVQILSQTRLESLVNESRSKTFFEQEVEPVYLDLVDALFASADLIQDESTALPLLLAARDTIEQFKVAELRDYFNDPCITELASKTTALDKLIDDTAIIYPIALPNRLELLVSLPSGFKRFTVNVSREAFKDEVSQFRGNLNKVYSLLYRRQAKTLYNWLIKPIESALDSNDVSTLVFVPGPVLRLIPMPALYDGKQFLVEKYALATAPSLNLVDPKPIEASKSRLLLAGLTQQVQGFAALPKVDDELHFVETLFAKEDSKLLLNQQFSTKNIKQSLSSTQPNIVHIASHAKFGGRLQDNFVLAYDEKIDMDHLRDYIGVSKYRSEPLELLILSACETASGDERAALGLAGVSIQAGARSAMGSLWKIDDTATLELIRDFYTELVKPENSKAMALQKAQLQMIKNPNFKHPYFWSPFLIINNWL